MPRWLAGILVLGVVAGGAYVGYRLYANPKGPTMHTLVVEDPLVAQRDGPHKRENGVIHAHRANTHFSATPRDGSYVVSVVHSPDLRRQWAKADLAEAYSVVLKILNNAQLAKDIELTPQQRKAIGALPSYAVILTEEQRNNLIELTRAWDAATGEAKVAARTRLLDAVAATGAAHLEQCKANWITRVSEVPKIVTPEQLAAARKWEPPAAKPAAAPAPKPVPTPAPAKPAPAPAPAPQAAAPAQ